MSPPEDARFAIEPKTKGISENAIARITVLHLFCLGFDRADGDGRIYRRWVGSGSSLEWFWLIVLHMIDADIAIEVSLYGIEPIKPDMINGFELGK